MKAVRVALYSAPSSGVGIYGGKILYRSDLVVLSVLGGDFFRRDIPCESQGRRVAAGVHLHSGGWRIDSAVGGFRPHSSNAASRQISGAQDHDVDLRVPYSSGDRRPLYASRIRRALDRGHSHRCIAAAAHQGFSANIFTTTSDMFPKRAVSSVTGLGGLAGALGSIIMQSVSGVIRQVTGSYVIMFIVAGSVCMCLRSSFSIFSLHHGFNRWMTRLSPKNGRCTSAGVTAFVFAVLGFVVGVLSFILARGSCAPHSRAHRHHSFGDDGCNCHRDYFRAPVPF